MSALVILSLCTRAPQTALVGGDNGSTCIVGLSTVHMPSTILHGTPITLLMASLSHLSRCSKLLTSRALNTPSAVLHEILGTVASHSQPHSELASGIHSVQPFWGYWSRQHHLSAWYKLLCWLLAMQSFKWRRTVSTLSGTWTKCFLHVPPTTARPGSLLGDLSVCSTPHGT